MRMQLDTDCEGPLALNDNAFELCRDLIPAGDRFFSQVSRYDDYLADIAKKPGYRAGDTLKLILPFLKAYGLTNAQLLDYSRRTVRLVPRVEAAYRFLHSLDFPIFMVSTSYRQFAEAVGGRLGIAADHIFCTELDLNQYRLSASEAAVLKGLKEVVVGLSEIELPPGAACLADLPAPTQEAIARLDRIFWEKLPDLDIALMLAEVNPVGGAEKARALSESLARTGLSLADAIYVGDSITDVQAFEAVRVGGGLGISFNGNRYAVEAAEIIVVADNAWPIALLVSIFRRWGKEGVLELATSSQAGRQKIVAIPEAEVEALVRGLEGGVFNLYLAGAAHQEAITRESTAMRARLRGATIAALG